MLLDNTHATDRYCLRHNEPWHHKVNSPVFVALHSRGELLDIVVWAVLVSKSEPQLRQGFVLLEPVLSDPSRCMQHADVSKHNLHDLLQLVMTCNTMSHHMCMTSAAKGSGLPPQENPVTIAKRGRLWGEEGGRGGWAHAAAAS